MGSSNDADEQPWMPTSADLIASIEKQSAEHRADPAAFVAEFIEMYAADHSREELDTTWLRLVKEYPWYCDDLLVCLDVVLLQVDRPLSQWVTEQARCDFDEDAYPSQDELQALGRRWLQNLRDRFRPIFEERSS